MSVLDETDYPAWDRLQKELSTLKAEIARVKESWDKTAWENTSLIQKKCELEEENEMLKEKIAELEGERDEVGE